MGLSKQRPTPEPSVFSKTPPSFLSLATFDYAAVAVLLRSTTCLNLRSGYCFSGRFGMNALFIRKLGASPNYDGGLKRMRATHFALDYARKSGGLIAATCYRPSELHYYFQNAHNALILRRKLPYKTTKNNQVALLVTPELQFYFVLRLLWLTSLVLLYALVLHK
jgi:hypothetical protein